MTDIEKANALVVSLSDFDLENLGSAVRVERMRRRRAEEEAWDKIRQIVIDDGMEVALRRLTLGRSGQVTVTEDPQP